MAEALSMAEASAATTIRRTTGISCIVVAALASAMLAHIAPLGACKKCGQWEEYSSGGACLRHGWGYPHG